MPRDPEGPIQTAIVDYLRTVMPSAIVHHCKNEINKSGPGIAREIAKAKRLGMVPGFPDLLVLPFANVGPILFEVKAEGNYASKPQKEIHERLRGLGYRVAVVRSIDDVRECLREWGVGFAEKLDVKGQIGGDWKSIGDVAKGMVYDASRAFREK